VEQKVLAAVRRELEAVVHDSRRREAPQIDVVAKIRGDVQVQETIAIVIDPDCAIAIDPAAQSRCFGDILEVVPIEVPEQRQVSVAIHQHVLAAIVVEVAPDTSHRDALARAIEIRQSRACCCVFECPIALVSV